jgi:very-short-patch-repair endonuclease
MTHAKKSVRERVVETYARTVFTRSDLLAGGMTGRQITDAVRAGILSRIRRDRYAVPQTDGEVIEAVRIGGRLSCLSLLIHMGVFVHRCDRLHVQVVRGTSRLREPASGRTRLHWTAVSDDRWLHAAGLIGAVRESIRCQAPRAAVATLDSLLHHGVMTRGQLEEVFRALPPRYRALLALVDESAESGPETFLRLLLRTLGVPFDTQVVISGVGRVDFVVDGWLIVECDSREFHEGWEKHAHDRRRDLAAAALGFVTIRPLAVDIMERPEEVMRLLTAILGNLGIRVRS